MDVSTWYEKRDGIVAHKFIGWLRRQILCKVIELGDGLIYEAAETSVRRRPKHLISSMIEEILGST